MSMHPRRLRSSETMRRLARETRLSVDQLVMPLFVRPGRKIRAPIPSLPGQFQLSVDQLAKEAAALRALRIPAVLLFGTPPRKDKKGGEAYAKDGIVQQAVRALKTAAPDLVVITDVCLCAFMSHGHCGVVKIAHGSQLKIPGQREKACVVDNEATLPLLAKTAVSHAQAGADIVAPSAMMDGQVAAIRHALDGAGLAGTAILSYAAKFASSFYGPFRDAMGSAPSFGDRGGTIHAAEGVSAAGGLPTDRKTYQMDPANADEALREVALDVEEGADLVMVKPALAYLDVIRRVKDRCPVPVAAYNVSGEYAMVKAAASRGWVAERAAALEELLAMKRAGADIIITYWAKDAAIWLQER